MDKEPITYAEMAERAIPVEKLLAMDGVDLERAVAALIKFLSIPKVLGKK